MAWYKTGSINMTNGSATVYGNGTLWVDAAILNAGDLLIAPDGKLYEIGSFQSNTQLTLTTGYLGTAANAQAYAIVPIGLLPSALAQQVKTTLSTANTALSQAVRFDATQNLTAPQQATARSNIGALAGADVGLGLLSKSVAGNVDVTLTGIEAAALFYEFSGTLTGNINVIVPNNVRQFFVRNATTGAYTLTVKTLGGTGLAIVQGARTHLECDGINVIAPTSLSDAIKVDGAGNVGIGAFAKGSSGGFGFLELAAATWMCQASNGNSYYGKNWYYNGVYKYKTANRALLYVQDDGGHSWHVAPVGTADAAITFTQAMTLDPNGNLLVGVTTGSGHRLYKNTGEGSNLLNIEGSLGNTCLLYGAGSFGWNAAGTAMLLAKNSTSGRSINAAGTINASGADYAEYMTKAEGVGAIAKGAIVGIDVDGYLTDKWAAAVSFLIKSSDPSYVGGDIWGTDAALGMPRPVEPVFVSPAYTGSAKPADLAQGEATWSDRDDALAQYEADQTAYADAVQASRTHFDTVTMPAYQAVLATFEAKLEAARQKVDRIAYCGQVPVNVQGAKPGQYIVPVQDGDGIGGQLVDDDMITFAQYRRAVGVVQNILPDGRANVRVKVV